MTERCVILPENLAMPSNQSKKGAASFARQFAVAMQAPFTLVAFVAVGGVIGYFVDRWLHTTPLFLILLLILGMILGIRDILKSLNAAEKNNHE